jgi:single-strand DNA-binding protein
MTSYNHVILTGKVATLPRRRYRPDGSPVIQFPLEMDVVDSTLREVKDLPGQEQPQGKRRPGLNPIGSGSFIDIVAFGELAEFKFDLLQSGQHLLVLGRLNQRHWQTPEGKKRTRTEVIAKDLRSLEETNQTILCPACGRPCAGLVQGRQVTDKMSSMERGKKNEETY